MDDEKNGADIHRFETGGPILFVNNIMQPSSTCRLWMTRVSKLFKLPLITLIIVIIVALKSQLIFHSLDKLFSRYFPPKCIDQSKHDTWQSQGQIVISMKLKDHVPSQMAINSSSVNALIGHQNPLTWNQK